VPRYDALSSGIGCPSRSLSAWTQEYRPPLELVRIVAARSRECRATVGEGAVCVQPIEAQLGSGEVRAAGPGWEEVRAAGQENHRYS
jgi:hypothetical protein